MTYIFHHVDHVPSHSPPRPGPHQRHLPKRVIFHDSTSKECGALMAGMNQSFKSIYTDSVSKVVWKMVIFEIFT